MATGKVRYVLQFALGWMEQSTVEPAANNGPKGKPAYTPEAAEALMRLMLCEMGPNAKGRIFCPDTGKYRVLLHAESEQDNFKTFDGREDK